ncbi:MAG: CaiB/BaiF CoA transferase family protein [Pseudomonadota bacterium]
MGPLTGYRIIEIAGIGPGPFCAMMLADQGAEVIRIDRPGDGLGGVPRAAGKDFLNRGRRSLAIDLKHPAGVEAVLALAARADGLIEGFRPGVMERLGLGPEACLSRNPRLVYGRMTGWGQDGPWAGMAGHDIDYIALAGVLHACGRQGAPPVPPLNLVGDFGGGGMLLAFGMVCALLNAQKSGRGQVIDAAMVDGAALLMTMMHSLHAMGLWEDARGVNILDGGAHFYEVYETRDGKYLAVGAIEPQFYAILLEKTGLGDDPDFAHAMDRAAWPRLKAKLAAVIKQKTRAEWEAVFDGTDACVAPVLSMSEAPDHPHLAARGTFVTVAGARQAAPAPRFSRTPAAPPRPPATPGQHSRAILADWGFADADITALVAQKVVRQA